MQRTMTSSVIYILQYVLEGQKIIKKFYNKKSSNKRGKNPRKQFAQLYDAMV